MTTPGYSLRRLVVAGAFAVATLAAPGVVLMSGAATGSGPISLADCQDIPIGLGTVGAYTQNCDLAVTPPPAIGSAPSAGAIVACRGIAGCLSGFVNSPGWVQVPQRSNAIQNSQ
jgi:hypothetical protein